MGNYKRIFKLMNDCPIEVSSLIRYFQERWRKQAFVHLCKTL